jgi:hypothetical protein
MANHNHDSFSIYCWASYHTAWDIILPGKILDYQERESPRSLDSSHSFHIMVLASQLVGDAEIAREVGFDHGDKVVGTV